MTDLENVSTGDLCQILAEVDDADATQRLMAAIAYEEIDELTQNEAADLYGFSSGWASKWFNRLERLETEPFDEVVYDEPRSGRPSELSEQDHERFVDALHESPEVVGIDAPAWFVPLAGEYLTEEFDVDYCDRHVRRLLTEAGLSWKTARPEYYKSDERAQEAFQNGLKKAQRLGRRIHDPRDRSDATGALDADLLRGSCIRRPSRCAFLTRSGTFPVPARRICSTPAGLS